MHHSKTFCFPLECIQAVNTIVVVNDDFKEYAYLLAFCQEVQSIVLELLKPRDKYRVLTKIYAR